MFRSELASVVLSDHQQQSEKNKSQYPHLLLLAEKTYSCQDDQNETLTYPHMPTFIIAGAQKSGTTSLYNILKSNPSLFSFPKVESHFFDFHFSNSLSSLSDGDICSKGYEYSQTFKATSEQNDGVINGSLLAFEKTPWYIMDPHIPEKIHKTCPWGPKIIITLRNPIDRAYSHFMMDKKRYYTHEGYNITFSEKIEQDFEMLKKHDVVKGESLDSATAGIWNTNRTYGIFRSNSLMRGLYAEQLKLWHGFFPLGEQMMVIQYEKFKTNRTKVYNEVLEFIGAPPHIISENDMAVNLGPDIKDNRLRIADPSSVEDETRKLLSAFYKPYNDDLADLLGEQWRSIWD